MSYTTTDRLGALGTSIRTSLRPPVLALVGTLGLGLALGRSGLMPSSFGYTCPFKALTGYNCPGCGLSRCVNALAHGHLGAAIHFNALFFVVMAALAWGWWAWFRSDAERRPLPPPRLWVLVGLLAVTLVFSILRNVPGMPVIGLA
jgi:hypothetical protein